MIYLVKSPDRNGTWFKVGFTSNLMMRLTHYYTHNPNFELLETVDTYKKTKHKLETEIHNEISALGFNFKVAKNGTKTEWFFIPKENEEEFERNGLGQFKAVKGRKIYKAN